MRERRERKKGETGGRRKRRERRERKKEETGGRGDKK